MRWAANLVILGGVLLVGYGVLWQVGLAPGSRVTLPAPVALARATPSPSPESAVVPTVVAATPTPATVTVRPTPLPPHLAPLPPAPDALDRRLAAERPPPGY